MYKGTTTTVVGRHTILIFNRSTAPQNKQRGSFGLSKGAKDQNRLLFCDFFDFLEGPAVFRGQCGAPLGAAGAKITTTWAPAP